VNKLQGKFAFQEEIQENVVIEGVETAIRYG
jgi:hypothetical protein